MRRSVSRLAAAALVAALALSPAVADARAGSGGSFGSRGSRTWSAPAPTNTAPYAAQPFERSLTPNTPGYAQPSPGFAPGYARSGSPFASGLLGGLVGVGLGGLLFGHGLFGGFHGIGSLFGFIIQMLLLYFVGRWLWRTFAGGQPALAGGPGFFARMGGPQPTGGARPATSGARPSGPPLTLTPADYAQFEQLLKAVQAAWSGQDTRALQSLATPEMVGVFGEQLAEQASRGVRNTVTDVTLQRGDLSEAWSERGREYATVAMRFSMIDVTRDQTGRIVDGSPTEHVTATEIWTFLRSPGGRWILSGIQQAR